MKYTNAVVDDLLGQKLLLEGGVWVVTDAQPIENDWELQVTSVSGVHEWISLPEAREAVGDYLSTLGGE